MREQLWDGWHLECRQVWVMRMRNQRLQLLGYPKQDAKTFRNSREVEQFWKEQVQGMGGAVETKTVEQRWVSIAHEYAEPQLPME